METTALGDPGTVLLIAASRDRSASYLDARAYEASKRASVATVEDGDESDDDAQERRIFMATRRYERMRECAKTGGVLTRATLNELVRRDGTPSTATWATTLRRVQRAMQRLPPGTSSSIRVSSTREVQLETERATFSRPARTVGRKRGVFIGVNYAECAKDSWRLHRRGQDAIRMREYLKNYCGYDDDDEMMVLLDDAEVNVQDASISRTCTKRAILKACRWLTSDVKEGDSLFFYFSGRAFEVEDIVDKSRKGLDKTALCASDTPIDPGANRITRRELREALIHALPSMTHLTVFIDSYGGGGEHALHELPYSCVNIIIPDERDIKNAKNGKNKPPALMPLWMAPNAGEIVRDFLALAEETSSLQHKCDMAVESVETIVDELKPRQTLALNQDEQSRTVSMISAMAQL